MGRLIHATLILVLLAMPAWGQTPSYTANGAQSTLASGIAAGATSFTVTTGEGARFPATSSGQFYVTIYNATDYPAGYNDPSYEVVLVTAHTGGSDTFTTDATVNAHNTGGKTYAVVATWTATDYNAVRSALVTFGTPQAISTSASPSFAGQTLTGGATWNNLASQNTFTAYDNSTTGAGIAFRKARGTSGTPYRAQSGDTMAAFNFRAFYNDVDNTTLATATGNTAWLRAITTENQTSTGQGNKVTIGTTAIGAATGVERLAITDTGLSLSTANSGLFGTTSLPFGIGTTTHATLTSSALTLASGVSLVGPSAGLTFYSDTSRGYASLHNVVVPGEPGGGSEQSQNRFTLAARRDSVSTYFNPVYGFAATDGSTALNAFEIGAEGNYNAGVFTLGRLYAWDNDNSWSIWRYETNQDDRMLIGGDEHILNLQIDKGQYFSRTFVASAAGTGLSGYKYRGTDTVTPRRAQSGDTLTFLRGFGGEAADDSTGATTGTTASAEVRFDALAAHTTSNHYAQVVIATAGSGSTTLTNRVTVSESGWAADTLAAGHTKALTDNSATSVLSMTLASNSAVGALIRYTIEATDGTDFQIETGTVVISAVNKAGAFTVAATEVNSQQSLSSGTMTTAWTISSANPTVISVNANTSLTPSGGYPRITFNVENLGRQAVSYP